MTSYMARPSGKLSSISLVVFVCTVIVDIASCL